MKKTKPKKEEEQVVVEVAGDEAKELVSQWMSDTLEIGQEEDVEEKPKKEEEEEERAPRVGLGAEQIAKKKALTLAGAKVAATLKRQQRAMAEDGPGKTLAPTRKFEEEDSRSAALGKRRREKGAADRVESLIWKKKKKKKKQQKKGEETATAVEEGVVVQEEEEPPAQKTVEPEIVAPTMVAAPEWPGKRSKTRSRQKNLKKDHRPSDLKPHHARPQPKIVWS